MVSAKPDAQQARSCGGCNVCCTAMKVTPLNKPAGVACEHENEQGCGIYDERPQVCRVWYCMWVRDRGRVFAEHHRPDRLGVFFTASDADPRTGRQTIYAHEIQPHFARTPEPQHIIEKLARYAPVQVIPAPAQTDATPIRLTHNGHALS